MAVQKMLEKIISGFLLTAVSAAVACFSQPKDSTDSQHDDFIDPIAGTHRAISAKELICEVGMTACPNIAQSTITAHAFGSLQCHYARSSFQYGASHPMRDAIFLPSMEPRSWDWKWKHPNMNHNGHGQGRLFNLSDFEYYIEAPLMNAGYLKEDQSGVIDQNKLVVILTLGRGYFENQDGPGQLKIRTSVVEAIEQKHYVGSVIVLKTAAAIEKYKELVAQGFLVALMCHNTC